jgi:hypothetical protein
MLPVFCGYNRAKVLLQHWCKAARVRAHLRLLLQGHQQLTAAATLRKCMGRWRDHLAARVAKRMKALSALLHWERAMLRKAWVAWRDRQSAWQDR